MFQNIYNLVKGLKNIFGIKSLLTIIQKNFNSNLSILEQETKWLELRSMIFESGSLYIKFLQWYISKLKSNILDTDTIETRNLSKFVAFFEDIFENCPFHSLDDTINIFINELNYNNTKNGKSKKRKEQTSKPKEFEKTFGNNQKKS